MVRVNLNFVSRARFKRDQVHGADRPKAHIGDHVVHRCHESPGAIEHVNVGCNRRVDEDASAARIANRQGEVRNLVDGDAVRADSQRDRQSVAWNESLFLR